MSAIHFRAPLVAVVLVLLFSTEASAQAAATAPFAKVPALPTVCYTGNDPFVARIEAAKNAGQADIDRQKAVNATIEENAQNIDPMEKVTRMQQWMMSNPQEATTYMQAAQSMGESQDQLHALLAEEGKFNEEMQSLPARYQSALKQAYAPKQCKRPWTRKSRLPANAKAGISGAT